MSHAHDHEHQHDHQHVGHDGLALARRAFGRRDVHRLGRRRFLAELGRGTVAVAILGGATAACSGDDATTATEPTSGSDATSPGTRASTTTVTTTAATATTSTIATADELRWEQVSLGFVSAYVLVRGNTAAVVDTGTSGSADAIGESLGLLGATFDDVAHVVLTHRHPDHVGSLPEVLGRSPSATAYAGEGDLAAIGNDALAVFDGDDVFGLQVIETPGHTPGSISLFDPGIGLLVAGDALNGNEAGDALTGANPEFTDDMDLAADSVAKLAALDVRAAVFGHGQPVRQGAGELIRALV